METKKEVGDQIPSSVAELGNRLRDLEARHYERRAEMAKVCGKSKSTIQAWMNGTDPSVFALARLCEDTGVSMDWLVFGREGNAEKPATDVDAELLEAVLRQLLKRLAAHGLELDEERFPKLAVLLYQHLRHANADAPGSDAFADMLVKM